MPYLKLPGSLFVALMVPTACCNCSLIVWISDSLTMTAINSFTQQRQKSIVSPKLERDLFSMNIERNVTMRYCTVKEISKGDNNDRGQGFRQEPIPTVLL